MQAQPLSPLDIFSAGRDTGLGADLWKGSSADLARAIIPTLADHPLSPAGTALALRVLAQAATAPDGAGADADLAAARARALLALGDAAGAAAILDRTANVAHSAALSQTAADAALIDDQPEKACAIGDALAVSRDAIYWLRLRAFCQARSGQAAAQLTASLADEQAKDPVFDRMISVIIAGAGDPGPASLRNGLDYAMSRQLQLDLTPALPAAPPAIAAHLAPASPYAAPHSQVDPAPPPPGEADVLATLRKAKTATAFAAAARIVRPDIVNLVQAKAPLRFPVQLAAAALAAHDPDTALAIRATLTGDTVPGAGAVDLAILDAALAVAATKADAASLDHLIERGDKADDKDSTRARYAAAFVITLGWPTSGEARSEFGDFDIGTDVGTPGRLLLLDAVADQGLRGDAALLALSIAEAGGDAGPNPADRARIVRALDRADLKTDARGFAIEGLVGLEPR